MLIQLKKEEVQKNIDVFNNLSSGGQYRMFSFCMNGILNPDVDWDKNSMDFMSIDQELARELFTKAKDGDEVEKWWGDLRHRSDVSQDMKDEFENYEEDMNRVINLRNILIQGFPQIVSSFEKTAKEFTVQAKLQKRIPYAAPKVKKVARKVKKKITRRKTRR